MKTTTAIAALAAAALVSLPAAARDDRLNFPIGAALDKGQSFKEKLDPEIKLHFAKQKGPVVEKRLGEYTSNKKTNAANKSDQDACDIAFISAVVSLQQRARKEGGNAVVNIRSVYKNDNVESATEYLCGAGTFMAGVALRGEVVTIKEAPAKKK